MGQPFVLLSHLRSGTHLLRTTLESHPAVQCQAEPFNSDSPELPYPLHTPTRVVLEEWAWRLHKPGAQAVGFVLHLYHPMGLRAFPGIRENPSWNDVWELLAGWPGLRVVGLQRDNLLRRHVSHVLARQRRHWHTWTRDGAAWSTHLGPAPDRRFVEHRPPAAEPIRLDPRALTLDFEDVESLRARARQVLGHLPWIDVEYAELARAPAEVAAEVVRFLGLPPQPLRPGLEQLETRPLGQVISGYDELAQSFQGTPWARFFEE